MFCSWFYSSKLWFFALSCTGPVFFWTCVCQVDLMAKSRCESLHLWTSASRQPARNSACAVHRPGRDVPWVQRSVVGKKLVFLNGRTQKMIPKWSCLMGKAMVWSIPYYTFGHNRSIWHLFLGAARPFLGSFTQPSTMTCWCIPIVSENGQRRWNYSPPTGTKHVANWLPI